MIRALVFVSLAVAANAECDWAKMAQPAEDYEACMRELDPAADDMTNVCSCKEVIQTYFQAIVDTDCSLSFDDYPVLVEMKDDLDELCGGVTAQALTSAPGWLVQVDFGPEAPSCPTDTGPWPDFTVLTSPTGVCQRYNHTHSWQRTCVEKADMLEEYDNMDCEGAPQRIISTPISQACSFGADEQGYSATYCRQLPQQVADSTSHRLIFEMYHQEDPNCRKAIATWYTIANRCLYDDGFWFSTNQDSSGVRMTRFNSSDCTLHGDEVDVVDASGLGECTPWYLPDHPGVIFAFAKVYLAPAGTSIMTSMTAEKNHSE